jgi:hypothetical protein
LLEIGRLNVYNLYIVFRSNLACFTSNSYVFIRCFFYAVIPVRLGRDITRYRGYVSAEAIIKRVDLERQLRKAAYPLISDGAQHELGALLVAADPDARGNGEL